MFRWAPFPFVRITFFTILAILFYEYYHISRHWLWISTWVFFGLFCLLIIFIKSKQHFRYRFFYGWIGLLTLFLFAQLRTSYSDPENQTQHLIYISDSTEYIFGKIITAGEETEKTFRYVLRVKKVKTGKNWQKSSGKIHLYLSKSLPYDLALGDEVLIKEKPAIVEPPLNPGQFDYRKYLARQNIHHQLFIREENLIKTGNQLFFLQRWAHDIRSYALQQLARINDHAAQGVIQGLVLGSKDNIDRDTKNAYTAAGLMHILAVSGLHVGIIYGILILLLGQMRNHRYGKIIFASICIIVLWVYALITGLSPSVVRASVMFSFFAIAATSRRQKNSYNILAASAFLMLMVNPDLLFTVSFQLSYLAVLGILYLQPRLENFWQAPNVFSKRIWQLFTVGLAAQIATLPITLYYFNQIPVFSALVGVAAVPLATFSFSLALAFLAFSQLPWISEILLFLLEKSVQIINWLATSVESFKFSLIENIFIDEIQVIVIYGSLLSLLIFLYFKKFHQLVWFFLMVLSFNFYTFYKIIEMKKSKNLVIFSVPGEQAGQINLNGKGYWLNKQFHPDDKLYDFYVAGYNLNYNIDLQQELPLAGYNIKNFFSIYQVEGHKIIFLQKLPDKKFKIPIKTDYLIAGYNSIRSLSQFDDYFKAGEIILDSSNSDWLVRQLLTEAEQQNVTIYAVNKSGAKLIEF